MGKATLLASDHSLCVSQLDKGLAPLVRSDQYDLGLRCLSSGSKGPAPGHVKVAEAPR